MLLGMFQSYLQRETVRGVENGIRVSVIGRRDRLRSPCARRLKPPRMPLRAALHCTSEKPWITLPAT
jgi:hypothetical protein